MGVLSGEGGAVNGESTVDLWEVQDFTDPTEGVFSNTRFGVDQGCGVKDWFGWFTSKVHTAARFPGEDFTFTGNLGNGKGFTGTAICDAIQVAAEIERGQYIQCLTRFSCNGIPNGLYGSGPAMFPGNGRQARWRIRGRSGLLALHDPGEE